MYQQIKQMADNALALQNKDSMDVALREISALCDQAAEQQPASEEMPLPFERNTGADAADDAEGSAQ